MELELAETFFPTLFSFPYPFLDLCSYLRIYQ